MFICELPFLLLLLVYIWRLHKKLLQSQAYICFKYFFRFWNLADPTKVLVVAMVTGFDARRRGNKHVIHLGWIHLLPRRLREMSQNASGEGGGMKGLISLRQGHYPHNAVTHGASSINLESLASPNDKLVLF